jgi:small GTP-binding protein
MSDTSIWKIILVGDVHVGKTSILKQYECKSFSSESPAEMTVGVPHSRTKIQTSQGPQIFQIWDTAGQERYRSLIPMYARAAAAALVVLSVTDPNALDSAEQWIAFVRHNCPSQCQTYLVANKIDLPASIDWGKLTELARRHELPLVRTSATEYLSVAQLFELVAEEVMNGRTCAHSTDTVSISMIELPDEERKKCC